jgi:hypothetical protein
MIHCSVALFLSIIAFFIINIIKLMNKNQEKKA